ncbi:hypothetical protein OSB04_002834 [Centaurea solstitialis]|uniref:Uncharacterized protein n=1 Tax=Centaurea solstitialis TaxID=347529 RepID=A0AA38U181_9ASTR|nr:hypothetical protein OSB04_002535 [Centaurea solstitialis]KAJ9566868.1 hypothetical protein OSB04_002834 [Centaurea solstitialis]
MQSANLAQSFSVKCNLSFEPNFDWFLRIGAFIHPLDVLVVPCITKKLLSINRLMFGYLVDVFSHHLFPI